MTAANVTASREATLTAGAAGRTARKAAAAVLASAARVLKMTAFCMAVVAVPAACSAITGRTPIECGEGCQDV